MGNNEPRKTNGKWVVIGLLLVGLLLTTLRWIYIPKTNPRQADPGNPFYSPPRAERAPGPQN